MLTLFRNGPLFFSFIIPTITVSPLNAAQAETDIQRDYIFAAADINLCPLKLLLPSEVMFLWERY